MIRVLLVDDHATFRQPLAFMLEREPDITVVGQAGSIAEALPLLARANVAVVDLDLPDGNGAEVIRAFRTAHPRGVALVLTASVGRRDLAPAVQAGAAALLHKSNPLETVIEAIRRAFRGEQLMSARDLREMLDISGKQREEDQAAQRALAGLTRREREVLGALGAGLNDREIAAHLHVGSETVRTHMVNLLGKLGVNSRLQALVFAIRHGAIDINGRG